MERKVYRALDREASFFGIRGRYIALFIAVAVPVAMVAVVVGRTTQAIFGTLVMICGAAGDYAFTRSLQARMSTKAFTRFLYKGMIPAALRVTPKNIKRRFS